MPKTLTRPETAEEPIAPADPDPVEAEPEAIAAIDEPDAVPASGEVESEPDDSLPGMPSREEVEVAVRETLSRYQSPSLATSRWLQARLEERLDTVEEGAGWLGIQVITRRDLLEIFALDLPVPSEFSAEVRTGGHVLVHTICPECSEVMAIDVSVVADFKHEGGDVPKLKPKFKGKARDHNCGQQALPLVHQAKDQMAMDEAATGPEPTWVEVLTVAELQALLNGAADTLGAGTVPETTDAEVEAWPAQDMALVAEWARAVIAGEKDRPPMPAVLRSLLEASDAILCAECGDTGTEHPEIPGQKGRLCQVPGCPCVDFAAPETAAGDEGAGETPLGDAIDSDDLLPGEG